MTPEGNVTLRDVYEAINDLRGEVAGKIKAIEDNYRTCTTCDERHRYLNALPPKVWGVSALIALVPTIIAIAAFFRQ